MSVFDSKKVFRHLDFFSLLICSEKTDFCATTCFFLFKNFRKSFRSCILGPKKFRNRFFQQNFYPEMFFRVVFDVFARFSFNSHSNSRKNLHRFNAINVTVYWNEIEIFYVRVENDFIILKGGVYFRVPPRIHLQETLKMTYTPVFGTEKPEKREEKNRWNLKKILYN